MSSIRAEGSDDRALMRAVHARDPSALEELYDRHSGLVLAVCLRVLGDRAAAEEVVGDVFWELWERHERYDPSRGHPRTYLLTLARSRALDKLRSAHRRSEIALDAIDAGLGLDADHSGAATDPHGDAVASQKQRRVRRALAGLSNDQRRAVVLSFYHGLSHADIAAQLDTPLGTIKSRIRQGLSALRTALCVDYEGEGS